MGQVEGQGQGRVRVWKRARVRRGATGVEAGTGAKEKAEAEAEAEAEAHLPYALGHTKYKPVRHAATGELGRYLADLRAPRAVGAAGEVAQRHEGRRGGHRRQHPTHSVFAPSWYVLRVGSRPRGMFCTRAPQTHTSLQHYLV
eukprot:scaffold90010_cov71-Phaeocystis_antarctica.AAC.5